MKPKAKLTVRCDDAELEKWKEAAYVRRMSLSEWVRRVLTAMADETISK